MYGAWVSKDKLIPVVHYESHPDVAIEILFELFPNLDKEKRLKKAEYLCLFCKHYSVYRVMFRLGYIKLNYRFGNYRVYYHHSLKLSKFQEEIVDNAVGIEYQYLYPWEMEKVIQMNREMNE